MAYTVREAVFPSQEVQVKPLKDWPIQQVSHTLEEYFEILSDWTLSSRELPPGGKTSAALPSSSKVMSKENFPQKARSSSLLTSYWLELGHCPS